LHEHLSLGCTCCRAVTEHDVKTQTDAVISRSSHLIENQKQPNLFAICRGQTLQCRHCGALSFRRGVLNDRGGVITWTVYPILLREAELDLLQSLPTPVQRLYAEALQAIDAGLAVSAGAMMRAAVESMCQQFGVPGKDLAQKISNLKTGKNGPLSPAEAKALQEHRIFGNSCLHHGRIPTAEELSRAVSVLHHVLKTLYQLPKETEAFRALLTMPQ
jgi:hypothetical protein